MSRRNSQKFSLLDEMEKIEQVHAYGEDEEDDQGNELEDVLEEDYGEDDTKNLESLANETDYQPLQLLEPLYEEETEEGTEQSSQENPYNYNVTPLTSEEFIGTRRQSYSETRRSVRSESSISTPPSSSFFDDVDDDSASTPSSLQRRITIAEGTSASRRNGSLRRQNLYRQSLLTDTQQSDSQRSLTRSRSARQSARRVSTKTQPLTDSMAAVVDRLGTPGLNTEWENVAAAAAVVAASAQPPSGRTHLQFAQGDQVLVMLTLLNITNHSDDKDSFTIDPVNVFGYPLGEGETEAQKIGPHCFVICTVKSVHFDEDERYYTVIRGDTKTEQRADPGWMEPLRDPNATETAFRAAQRTLISKSRMQDQDVERDRPFLECTNACIGALIWPIRFVRICLIPWYRKTRAVAKIVMAHLLLGDTGYACKLRFTTINGLVLCSFCYLFLEIITLAFMSPDMDRSMAIVNFSVWLVLAIELVLEVLIRPVDYQHISHSDKAFAPSTARNINRYHLVFESLALLLFIPQLPCVFKGQCGERIAPGIIWSSLTAVVGESRSKASIARICLGLNFLRTFGLVRHWKKMWLNHTFEDCSEDDPVILQKLLLVENEKDPRRKSSSMGSRLLKRKRNDDDDQETTMDDNHASGNLKKPSNEEDERLKNAATIGTALMLVNSHRALIILLIIVTCFPAMYTTFDHNAAMYKSMDLLQANNVAANSSDTVDCEYLRTSVCSWIKSGANVPTNHGANKKISLDTLLLWAQLLPVRCSWQSKYTDSGVISLCEICTSEQNSVLTDSIDTCQNWKSTVNIAPESATPATFSSIYNVRVGGLTEISRESYIMSNGAVQRFYIRGIFNQNQAISWASASFFMLMGSILMLSLIGLSVMRADAGRLVLNPLRRMLKIVVRYAENPLSQNKGDQSRGSDLAEDQMASDQLGHYETEQLINAITKIADLLRKCWGVAGAGIISSNLARTKDGKTVVFNPTVPGKRVYALFGFVAINQFDKLLRALDRDVMILINDVARVVHDEVYRWALGDSGQCNKNLGSAFLMVFRIGDFTEVHDKKKRATDVVFNSQLNKTVKVRKRRTSVTSRRSSARRGSSRQFDLGSDGTLQLASLPGIQSFTDRALLGFLKSFAGIHRDRKLQHWQRDFRLGAGVGAFIVDIRLGMDAGWAVEGAVGSEYKIDATYLSPHVNMASRMMSASKQYGVTVLLSQAVEELLSKPARSKLRHLDTVYVKGSMVAQRIFTYDARYEGVDFFLFERTSEHANLEAEAYTPGVWDADQDLQYMRQHVTDEFMRKFREGVDQYLEGNWKAAINTLQDADNIMIQTVLEEGYIEYDTSDFGSQMFDRRNRNEEVTRIRNEFGDGACKCLIQYMERRKGVTPSKWQGVRHLLSK